MALWSETTTMYKVGIVGIVLSFVVFVVGFGTPVWSVTVVDLERDVASLLFGHGSVFEFTHGLWQICQQKSSTSKLLLYDCEMVFFDFIRGIEVVACVFHLASCLCALFKQRCSKYRPTGIAVLGTIAGVTGLIGETIFAVAGSEAPTSLIRHDNSTVNLSWSFALAVVGSGLVIIFSILVGMGSRMSVLSHMSTDASNQNMHELAGY
ncbi:uncharacterized protein LOC121379364 [Gigantopelta aegis]|uniref:uncharacterized protein LOC121379364 n=1 Tax=Gigantopelta aegis TaxID=1735272 RepID=UPI001B88A88D|nr:uncharacterized protein LOC121379364 [Gigantopelta aegis]